VATIAISAGVGAFIAHAAAAAGVDLKAATGFDPAIAADPDARISLERETELWDEAARLSGDDCFGLHAAQLLRPGAFGVVDYAARTAPTLRAALQRLARYNRLVHDAAVFSLIDLGESLRVEHAFRIAGTQSRHAAEFTMASLVVIGGQIAGVPLWPGAVEFRHPPPPRLDEHQRLFGVRPRFGAAVNAMELASEMLDRPSPAADPALWRVVERHAEALLAAQPEPSDSIDERVRRLLIGLLGEGEASLAKVAARLHMSERSLQRRLSAQGASFDTLLEDLRRELCLRYLADPKIAIAEVAYLVGYSEPSAFHRAFKRWTGTTPAEARLRGGLVGSGLHPVR
jgi:AraC-like DNA-binding protein